MSSGLSVWPGKPGFNPRSSHTKFLKKMVLDASLLNPQHYKVGIKVTWRNPGKKLHPLLHLGVVDLKRKYLAHPRLRSPTLLLLIYHHHHHVAPPARISLTVSRHFSLSFIASGRSSGLQPVSSHSCCM